MRFKRIIRGMGWGRNPLRRRSDRIEACLTLLFIAAMFAVGPWAASRAAQAAYHSDVRATAWEMQHRFQVDALLLEDARRELTTDADSPADDVPTIAQWIGRDAVIHTGTVFVRAGARAGTTVSIWIDDRGLLSGPPGRRSPQIDTVVAAVLTLFGIAGGLAGIRRIVRWELDRRRLRAWQLEWMTVGPGWTRQR
jgi:hypothetical protein